MRRLLLATALVSVGIFVTDSHAYGPHTPLDCLGCHDPHYAKGHKIIKVKNEIYPNPRTGEVIDHISALCMGCHNIQQLGGAGVKPIHLHMTHPVNVVPNPRIARVPEVLLRKDVLQCVSCHDPHPSNPNWRYLRVDTEEGTKVGQFCLMCHPAKAETAFYGTEQMALQVFTSMNEEAGPGSFGFETNELTIANPTPEYVVAFGDFPNSLAPAYPTVANMSWMYAPEIERLPTELQAIMRGETPAPATPQPAPTPAPEQ